MEPKLKKNTRAENSKTNEVLRFKCNLADIINFKSTNRSITLIILSIYYKWKSFNNIYNNNKFKISAHTWKVEFELPDGSNSIADFKDYFEYIIKKHET